MTGLHPATSRDIAAEAARKEVLELALRIPDAKGLDETRALRLSRDMVRQFRPATRLEFDRLVKLVAARCAYSDMQDRAVRAVDRSLMILGAPLEHGYTLARGIAAIERALDPDRFVPRRDGEISDDPFDHCDDEEYCLSEHSLRGAPGRAIRRDMACWRKRVAAIAVELTGSTEAA